MKASIKERVSRCVFVYSLKCCLPFLLWLSKCVRMLVKVLECRFMKEYGHHVPACVVWP